MENSKGLALSSMIVGIVNVTLGLLVGWLVPFLFVVTGGVGVVLAAVAMSNGNKGGQSVTGLVTNIVTLFLSGVWSLVLLVAILAG